MGSLFRYRGSEDGSLVPSQFIRSISFCVVLHSVEFRRELRLEAAAGLFELSFSPRHVSQQCVQLLRTQYQQAEHDYEQDFGTQTHDSPLVMRWSSATVVVLRPAFLRQCSWQP